MLWNGQTADLEARLEAMTQTRSPAIDDLVNKLKATQKNDWQYLEVKQLAEILARYREKMRLAIREYRLLKQTLAAETDAIEKLYLGYEGMFMRDHLRDGLRLYVMINRDFHEAYRSYFEALKNPVEVIPLPLAMMPAPKRKVSVANRMLRGRNAA
jgi:hypothetical protein